MATPSDILSPVGDEHDNLPIDELHTQISSQEGTLPDALAPGTPDSTDANEGSAANPSLVQEDGLEHDSHPHEPVTSEMASLAEADDGAAQDSISATLDVAQAAHTEELPRTHEDVSSPSSHTIGFKSSAKSRPLRRKRTLESSTPEPNPEKCRKRSTADRVQEELLAKANQLIDALVTVDDIIFALERFALVRDSVAVREDHAGDIDQHEPQQQDPDGRPGLKKWWDGLGVHEKGERWEKCLQRAFAGLFYGQYVDDRQAFDEQKKKGNLPHPITVYLDVCFPETVIPDGEVPSEAAIVARAQAKRRFQNEVQRKKLWVMMLKRYGMAMFLLLSAALQEDQ
jgi:hypothetical protein